MAVVEAAIVERFKQESMYGFFICRSGEVAMSRGVTVV